jgi:hypothetical protein
MSEQIPLKYQPLIERVKTKGSKSKAEAIKAFLPAMRGLQIQTSKTLFCKTLCSVSSTAVSICKRSS